MILDEITKFTYKNGKRHVTADILSSGVPGIFPTTGENITGLNPDDVLDPGSTIYIVNNGALYMMNEESQFKPQ